MTADQEPRRDWICMSLLVGALAGIAFGCVRIIALVPFYLDNFRMT